MIYSMTGFGRAEVDGNRRTLVAEARSVNHRFLELSIRLPRGFQPFEGKLRTCIQKQIARGKVNFTVSWKGSGENGGIALDMDMVQQYVDVLQEVRTRFDFREPVTLGQVLALPDLFKWSEPEFDPEEAWSMLEEVSTKTVDDLVGMRALEGESLAKDLRARVKTLRGYVAVVESRAPERVAESKDRLRSRVADLLKGEARVDEERLILEAAFLAERMDCTEECVRLASHLDQFEELLESGGAVGRKLNFLAQELNREANTIGSKANDVSIAREVIQLKDEIEIVREQIQNIE